MNAPHNVPKERAVKTAPLRAQSRPSPTEVSVHAGGLRALAACEFIHRVARAALLTFAFALLLAGWGTRPAFCDPPAPTTASLPDYGGRDGGMAALQTAAPDANPAAQAGRALEALVVVLVLVAGGVFGLKRLGLVGTDGKFTLSPGTFRLPKQPRREGAGQITVQSSQPLPGGGGLHVVSVAGRTLLLGATAQSVSLLVELDAHEADAPAFHDALAREQEYAAPPLSAAADRLQTILARSRTGIS